MLNRLYIVVGILAILILGAGFVVPRLTDWNGYRARLETMAEASLGTDVIIGGKIEFSLLPQPQIRFGNTIVGPAFSPLLEIDSMEADFSLMDFLRDRFVVTKLVLQSPKLNLTIDRSGSFEIPIKLREGIEAGKISIAAAQIANGSFRLTDERTDQTWIYDQFEGDLSISGMSGPFGLNGVGAYLDEQYSARLNLSATNEEQKSLASFFWKPVSGSYSLSGEGVVELGTKPGYFGEVDFRGAPILQPEDDGVFGDIVASSQIELSAEKLLLPAFELQPDENHAGSRLSGAAVVRFGESSNFDAVVSGGVVSFAPRDIRKVSQSDPYPLLELLNQLSAPFSPSIPGRIGVDIAELSIQDFALRNVRLDARSDGSRWTLDDFVAQYAGSNEMRLAGSLNAPNTGFGFEGHLSLQSARLGALAGLWKEVDRASVLHNIAGGFESGIVFGDGVLTLDQGQVIVEGATHQFEGRFELSEPRTASVVLSVGEANQRESAALFDLFPDFSTDGDFVSSFPQGHFEASAASAVLFGMVGKSLAIQADWDNFGVHIDRVSAFDLGGAQFSLSGEMSAGGTPPRLTGGGRITLGADAKAGFLAAYRERFGVNGAVTSLINRSLPLDFNLDLSPPDETGSQMFSASGRAGPSDVDVSVEMAMGLPKWRDAPIVLSGIIATDNPDGLAAQFGVGPHILLGEGEKVEIQFSANGTVLDKLETHITAHSGSDKIEYLGSLALADLTQVAGNGQLDFSLVDVSPLQRLAGIGGISLPSVAGTSKIAFGSDGELSLREMSVFVGEAEVPVAAQFDQVSNGTQRSIVGQVVTNDLSIADIASLVFGPASLISGDVYWPEGPLDLGGEAATSRGRIAVTSSAFNLGEKELMSEVGFDLVWNGPKISIENIAGESGEGKVLGNLGFCCTAIEGQKQVSGRFSLSNIQVSGIASAGIGQNISGEMNAGVLFEANGATFAELAASLSGEGSFSISEAVIHHLDPRAFSELVSAPNIAEMDGDALAALVGISLDQGEFDATNISGLFQIAAGRIRADNVSAANEAGRLLSDVRLDLNDLSLSGNWVLSPTAIEDPAGLVEQSSAQINAVLGGSFIAPTRTLDLGQMLEAIKLRALEIELDQLEELRAEQVARSTELAQNRARLMELEAQRKEEEAVRLEAFQEQQRQERAAATATQAQNAEETPMVFELDSQDPLLLQDQLLQSDSSIITLQPTDLLSP